MVVGLGQKRVAFVTAEDTKKRMWTQPRETTGEFSRNLNSRAFQFAEHDIRKKTTRRSSNERSKTLCGRLLMSFRKLLGDLGLEKKTYLVFLKQTE